LRKCNCGLLLAKGYEYEEKDNCLHKYCFFLLLVFAGSFFVIKHSKNNVSEQVTDGEQKYFYIEVNGGDFEITNGKETAYKGKADVEPYRPYIEGDLDMSFAGDRFKIPDFESEEQEYILTLLDDVFYDTEINYNINENDYYLCGVSMTSGGLINFTKEKNFNLSFDTPTFCRFFLATVKSEFPWIYSEFSSEILDLSVKCESDKIILSSKGEGYIDLYFANHFNEIEIKDVWIDESGIIITSDRKGNCIIKRKWKVLHKEYFGWPEEE